MANAPHPPYTPVVRAGDWIIVSGQLGMKDGALVPGGVAAQTAQAVVNLKAQLASMGATVNDIAKTLCFLTDMDTFATFNEQYAKGFGNARPARSTIGVASLPFGGAVEIEAWAYKPLTGGAKKSAKKAAKKSSSKKSAVKKTSKKKATANKATKKSVAKKTVKKSAKKSAARKKK
jgi:2-iminobutanoate/2-iminopropanoate deaminase